MGVAEGIVVREAASTALPANVARALDALRGLPRAFGNDQAVFIKTLDYLLINLHGPFALRIRDALGELDEFDTGHIDPSHLTSEAVSFPGDLSITLALHPLRGQAIEDAQRQLHEGRHYLAQVVDGLLHEVNLASRIGAVLRKGLSDLMNTADSPASASMGAPAVLDEEIGIFLIELQRALKSTARDMAIRNSSCARALFFRHAPASATSRAFHLLEDQRVYFDALARDKKQDHGAVTGSTLIQTVLDNSAPWRGLEDRMRKGVTSWVALPWAMASLMDDEEAERAGRLFGAIADDGEAALALCIPIHVGEAPWLVLALIFPDIDDPEERDEIAWYFYRDVGPYLNNTIRKLALNAYQRALRREMERFFSAPARDLEALNAGLAALTFSFPYPAWRVVERQDESPDATHVTLLDDERKVEAERHLPSGATDALRVGGYDEFTPTHFAQALSACRDSVRAVRTAYLERKMVQSRDFGHMLKNLLDLVNWEGSRGQVGEALQRVGRKASKEASALRLAHASLGLFAAVQGLGHALNTAGAHFTASPADEWRKVAKWIDRSPPKGQEVADAFARSVFAVATAMMQGRAFSSLVVRCPKAKRQLQERSWSPREDAHVEFDLQSLLFPPFKAGAGANSLFVLALVEPLRNAAEALVEAEQKLRRKRPLSIDIDVDEDGAGAITISNLGLDKLNPSLSGLVSANRLLGETLLFDISQPTCENDSDGAYVVSVIIRVTPQQFIAQVKQGASPT